MPSVCDNCKINAACQRVFSRKSDEWTEPAECAVLNTFGAVLDFLNDVTDRITKGTYPMCAPGESYRVDSTGSPPTLLCECRHATSYSSLPSPAGAINCDASQSLESHTVLFGVMCVLLYQTILMVTQLSQVLSAKSDGSEEKRPRVAAPLPYRMPAR